MKTLIIKVDEETNTITIVDEEGKEIFFQSVALLAGDAQNKEYLIKMYGASSDAAWAYGRGFVLAHSPQGGPALKNFYKQCAAHVCMAIDPLAFQQEVGADEIVNKWESEDQSKWAGWDTEDVLADKEASERKRRLN